MKRIDHSTPLLDRNAGAAPQPKPLAPKGPAAPGSAAYAQQIRIVKLKSPVKGIVSCTWRAEYGEAWGEGKSPHEAAGHLFFVLASRRALQVTVDDKVQPLPRPQDWSWPADHVGDR